MSYKIPLCLNMGVSFRAGVLNIDNTISWKTDIFPGIISDIGMRICIDEYFVRLSEKVLLGINEAVPIKGFIGTQTFNKVNGFGFTSEDIGKQILYKDGSCSRIIGFENSNTIYVDIPKDLFYTKMHIIDKEYPTINTVLASSSTVALESENSIKNEQFFVEETGVFTIKNSRVIKFPIIEPSSELLITNISSTINNDSNITAISCRGYKEILFTEGEVPVIEINLYRQIGCDTYSISDLGIENMPVSGTYRFYNNTFSFNKYSYIGENNNTKYPECISIFERKSISENIRSIRFNMEIDGTPYSTTVETNSMNAYLNTINYRNIEFPLQENAMLLSIDILDGDDIECKIELDSPINVSNKCIEQFKFNNTYGRTICVI